MLVLDIMIVVGVNETALDLVEITTIGVVDAVSLRLGVLVDEKMILVGVDETVVECVETMMIGVVETVTLWIGVLVDDMMVLVGVEKIIVEEVEMTIIGVVEWLVSVVEFKNIGVVGVECVMIWVVLKVLVFVVAIVVGEDVVETILVELVTGIVLVDTMTVVDVSVKGIVDYESLVSLLFHL